MDEGDPFLPLVGRYANAVWEGCRRATAPPRAASVTPARPPALREIARADSEAWLPGQSGDGGWATSPRGATSVQQERPAVQGQTHSCSCRGTPPRQDPRMRLGQPLQCSTSSSLRDLSDSGRRSPLSAPEYPFLTLNVPCAVLSTAVCQPLPPAGLILFSPNYALRGTAGALTACSSESNRSERWTAVASPAKASLPRAPSVLQLFHPSPTPLLFPSSLQRPSAPACAAVSTPSVSV